MFSTYIGNHARKELITKEQEFSKLLAVNLHNHIYRRFALPTILGFGHIELKLEFQFNRLDEIVKSTIHGLNVKTLRIYNGSGTVSYSTDKKEAGEKITSTDVQKAILVEDAVFSIDAKEPYWKSFFMFGLKEGTYTLKTTYPLRIEGAPSSSGEESLMGVLEFTRDITKDIERAVQFQQFLILITLLTSSILLIMLFFFIRRSERAIAARMEEEQRLVLELHQSEKLAGMGRVIASIAHEIRNPLGIIRSSAELLLKRGGDTDKVTSRILQAIYDEAKRLSQTVTDFLDYARPRALQKVTVSIPKVLDQALIFLEPELETRNLQIIREGVTVCQVAGDNDLLYRVFYNILANAIQAVGEKGTIRISILSPVFPPKTQGRFAQICFVDSGSGFSEEDISKVLDPFFTTKDDGTGLGLAIVNSIVQSHGGSLILSNAEEGGAKITVLLPL